MKYCKRIISFVTAAVLLLFSLTSCIDSNLARGTLEDFVIAVESNDFEKAQSYMHPSVTDDIEVYFNSIEKERQVDFQAGFKIIKYVGFENAFFDSNVGGSLYGTTATVKIGGMDATITVNIVENDAGYGIYNFTIEF